MRNSDLVNSIQNQFDLEILLKHRELRSIEDEIAKVHVMMVQLQKALPNLLDADTRAKCGEPNEFAEIYASYLRNIDQSIEPNPNRPKPEFEYFTRSSAKHKRNSSYDVYSPPVEQTGPPPPPPEYVYKRSDGLVVRMVCQVCGRDKFTTMQGFINHSRMTHQKEFSSYELAARDSGEPIDEQPALEMPPLNISRLEKKLNGQENVAELAKESLKLVEGELTPPGDSADDSSDGERKVKSRKVGSGRLYQKVGDINENRVEELSQVQAQVLAQVKAKSKRR
ncbi:hypothetical protein CANCADRAFT_55435 [Tortispora caseinolytica NRRL Y-17796]|uniref:AHC1-like C2H2 zinc-finger domain-containing protein n=1 Tax=Tortispora caseinolytica NRRL Y-17796 TaxID=767744 RepID=A0A1E4TIK5_9ASCO|nr:hypothetical protein CANCADRAFT_55435 [Tortispora caseinolytica NRRL Y-17796]